MLDELLYKDQLEAMKEYAKKKQYIPLSKINEILDNPSEELMDDVVEYLESCDIEVTRDSEEVPDDEALLTEEADDDFEAFIDDVENDEELEELTSAVESEIKVSDFEDFVPTSHQADDPVKMYLRDIGQIELLTITQESEYARTVQEGIMCKEKIEAYRKQGKEISPKELEELNKIVRTIEIQRNN